jgi:EMAP domain
MNKPKNFMKISYEWLKENLNFDLSPNKTAEILTDIGLEVEKIEHHENIKGGLNGLIVGQIKRINKHPNADKLNITKVDIGENKEFQIICGAPNLQEGQKVVIAKPGTTIYPSKGNSIKIKKTKIRGEESYGMICSEQEIGLGDDNNGIIILKNNIKIGDDLINYLK